MIKRGGSDIHSYLISCLDALSQGWVPPVHISEELYQEIKNDKENYPAHLVGYVGFQMSYGGKWFGGYRRDKVGVRDYSLEAYNNTMKQIPNLKGISFTCKDFRDIVISDIENSVIYCDIPYKDTTKYATEVFPYDDFYAWARAASERNTVLVSEYTMPSDFECIWEKEVKTMLNSAKIVGDAGISRVERLFILKK